MALYNVTFCASEHGNLLTWMNMSHDQILYVMIFCLHMKQRFAIVHFYGFSLHPNTFYIGFILWVFCSDVIGNFNGTISNMKNKQLFMPGLVLLSKTE